MVVALTPQFWRSVVRPDPVCHGCSTSWRPGSVVRADDAWEATIDPAAVCVDEKTLLGSYSASVELQEESVRFVMGQEMDLQGLISHRFSLAESVKALHLAAHPQPDSMKIVIQPGSSWEGSTQ